MNGTQGTDCGKRTDCTECSFTDCQDYDESYSLPVRIACVSTATTDGNQ